MRRSSALVVPQSIRDLGLRLITQSVMATMLVSVATADAPDVKSLFPPGVQQGQSRVVTVRGKPGTAPIRVWTSDERLTATADETGKELTLTTPAETPAGLYWLRVANDEGASTLQPFVVGVLPELVESDLQGESPQPLNLPATISGVLAKSGEVDTFDVLLKKGQTLIASIDSRRLLASPADVVIQLVTDRGFVIVQNDDHHAFDPQIVYTATEDATYTVRVFAFPADPNSTIRFAGGDSYVYRLTLTTGPFVDHLTPLSVPSAEPPNLQMYGWNLPEDSSLALSSAEASMPVAVPHPGSLLINRWTPAASPVVQEMSQSSSDQVVTVGVPGSVCGHIGSPGEADIYNLQGKKDQQLVVNVAAQSFDSPLDPVLKVMNADGRIIKEDDDIAKTNSDARLDVKLPADGEYRLEVTDRFGHGGMRYVYQLSVAEQQPTYRLSLQRSQFVVQADKPLEIPVSVERFGGFAGMIRIHLDGLPEGVTLAPVESVAKGDTAKSVTLKVQTSGSAQFGGPVTIIGEAEGLDPVPATAETPIVGLTFNDIWLTVIATPKTEEPPASE